jgi:serine O-acetyltransferase
MSAPLGKPRGGATFPDLARVVADLRDLRARSHQTRYGGGPLPELPSRTAMTEIIDGLIAALFPRHFGPPGLADDSLDAFVTYALTTALHGLQRQVRLELGLGAQDGQPRRSDHEEPSLALVNAFAAELPVIRARLEADIRAAYEGDPAATSLDEVMCCYPGVAAIIRHRLAHGLYRLGLPMLARIVSEVAHSLTGIDIHPGALIEESFFIDHGTGVVIGETAVIGRRVRIYQGVTLGARRFEIDDSGALAKNYPRHPILEDDVVVYAGASILGRITVGRGSTIAGSVWLTHDVPPGSTITQAKARSEAFDDGGGI